VFNATDKLNDKAFKAHEKLKQEIHFNTITLLYRFIASTPLVLCYASCLLDGRADTRKQEDRK
jgi:hypothetical protein